MKLSISIIIAMLTHCFCFAQSEKTKEAMKEYEPFTLAEEKQAVILDSVNLPEYHLKENTTPEEKYKDDPAALEEIKFMNNINREPKINDIKMQLIELDAKLSEINPELNSGQKTKPADMKSKQSDLLKKKQTLSDELKALESQN